MDLIDGLRAFVATAETGSFTAAADRLGMSNRLTSKYVAELEDRLGTRLLQRTTRRVGVTPAGETLLARAPALLGEMEAMLQSVTEDSRGFSGTLRISAPVTFGEVYVAGLLARFAAPHPDLTIDLRLSDAYVDLAAEGVDLAFRVGDTAIPSLKRRRLGQIGSLVVAAPDYLAQQGTPQTPQDLTGHLCIADTNRADPARWVFQRQGQTVEVPIPTRFLVNSARAARDMALAGRGIAYCPRFILTEALASGALVPLLPGYEGTAHPLHVAYLEGRALPPKLRALIDFAVKDMHQAPDL